MYYIISLIQTLYETPSLYAYSYKNGCKMNNLLYKVDTNFFETPLNKGFQSDKPIEWE